tara:strand:- start:549 stop:974 length:426 start_codon:yes stop_codon:yes gene_type:complete
MNGFKISYLAVFIFFILGCTSNEQKANEDNFIYGKWKLVKAYISAGGPQYWVDVEDGGEYVFFSDRTFTSKSFLDCTNGDFEIESNELNLMYDCQEIKNQFQDSNGILSYDFSFKENFLLLTPTTLRCIEGCSYKFKRISD